MHNKDGLYQDLKNLKLDHRGTLLVHSSMKSIGQVQGGADTVLDVLSDYMADGLLVLPTHTWSYINRENPRFYVQDSPSCVGILTELFRKRSEVIRSWHPTHSVAALGKDALLYTANDLCDTPCARNSVWGRLLDRQATILLIGVDLTRNTYIHGVEEWAGVPDRISHNWEQLYTILPDGREISVPSRRHCGNWSDYFGKIDQLLLATKVMYTGRFGDAVVRVCDCHRLYKLLSRILATHPQLFADEHPLPAGLYQQAVAWNLS